MNLTKLFLLFKLASLSKHIKEYVMCIRYESVHDRNRLHQYFGMDLPLRLSHSDVWPGKPSPFIRGGHGATGRIRREALIGSFGLVPRWAVDTQIARHAYNARCESVDTKPNFREAWERAQHCIIPLEAFFEPDWRTGTLLPARIGQANGAPLGAAGLWSEWKDNNGELLYSFALLTVNADADPLMNLLRKPSDEKRMLVILPPERYDDWLAADTRQSKRLLRLWPVELSVMDHKTMSMTLH
jgi:putative SOS response-associated peptidase YedK